MVTTTTKTQDGSIYTTHKFEVTDTGKILVPKVSYTTSKFPKAQLNVRIDSDNNKYVITLTDSQVRDIKDFADLTNRSFKLKKKEYKTVDKEGNDVVGERLQLLVERTKEEWKVFNDAKAAKTMTSPVSATVAASVFQPQKTLTGGLMGGLMTAKTTPMRVFPPYPADVETVMNVLVTNKQYFLTQLCSVIAVNGKNVPKVFIDQFRSTPEIVTQLTDDEITDVFEEIKQRILENNDVTLRQKRYGVI
jgi:hypothetical protein